MKSGIYDAAYAKFRSILGYPTYECKPYSKQKKIYELNSKNSESLFWGGYSTLSTSLFSFSIFVKTLRCLIIEIIDILTHPIAIE